MSFEKLHEKAIECVAKFRTAEKELFEILQEIEDQKGFRLLGYSSLFQYATLGLKLPEHQAYSLITISRKAKEVPELKLAIDEGRITTNQARRIASVVTPQNQEDWIKKAETLTQRELEKAVVEVVPKEAVREQMNYVNPAKVKLVCGISEELMKELEKIKDLISQRTSKSASLEDALKEMASLYLERKDPVRRAQRVLAKPKRLCTRLVTNRAIPARVKHEVNQRDQGHCAFVLPTGKPCGQSRWTEVHHVRPFSMGGRHEIQNLLTLCQSHHRAVHARLTPQSQDNRNL